MVRDAFVTMTQLNILLGAFALVAIILTGRRTRWLPRPD
jgi:hypothetical protein